MEVGCEIEESFQDTMRRLHVWALKYSIQKSKVLWLMFGSMQRFEGFVEDAVGFPMETSIDDTKIQVDVAVLWRGNV